MIIILGKQQRMKFGSGVHNFSIHFDYVHSNLWGPTRVATHSDGLYFISIIDIFSRKIIGLKF